MTVQQFIGNKSKQLSYYLRAFWAGRIPHQEIELYFWDVLEEWTQVTNSTTEPCSQRERVFWHLLHQMHFWPEQKLRNDVYLRSELETCMTYLEGEGECPLDCIGIRP
ncbi:hypothetical protein HMF8227_00552 [Saliniradius amylolyticus]|uniref:Uncharacterized protein n=1 Tax=Saliniradius amylolyticus TaxID=2183582 RepID=A0A2S2E081_9ALTE|nr:hypothetical protein [Saliniradius amylolyticus]AWL11048.1 hypothetical protein HMF8227_00552 [Saliniradius amylolyticus]